MPCELVVLGLFNSLIPASDRRRLLDRGEYAARNRKCMVPDAKIDTGQHLDDDAQASNKHLAEVKTLHVGRSTYPWPRVCEDRKVAVNERAAKLQREYEGNARQLDVDYGNTPPGRPASTGRRSRGCARSGRSSGSSSAITASGAATSRSSSRP